MTRLAAPQRALRIRKTLAALICLLLLGGIFTMILTAPSKIGNLAAFGFSSPVHNQDGHRAAAPNTTNCNRRLHRRQLHKRLWRHRLHFRNKPYDNRRSHRAVP